MSLPGLLLALYMVDLVYCGQYDNYMVQEHNKYRKMEAKKGAANMEKVVWSDTIANVALKWAKTCTVGHNGNTGYGENLYFHTIRDKGQERELIERGIKAWYDEYTLWNWSTGFTVPTGHYTQLVWAKTNEVGCAIYTCPPNGQFRDKFLYLSCFYNPPGNFNDNGKFRTGDPYIKGRACSKCAAGQQCNDGLCSGSNNGGNVLDNNSNGGETGTDNNVNWWDSNRNGGDTSSNNDSNWWNSNEGNTGGNSRDNTDSENWWDGGHTWDNTNSGNSWDNNGNSGNSWDNTNIANWWDGGQSWDNNGNSGNSWDDNGNSGNNNWDSWNSWDDDWTAGNSWDSNVDNGNSWGNNWNDGNSWDNNWNGVNSWENNWNGGNSWDSNVNSGNTWDNNWNNGNSWDNNLDDGNSWDNNWDDGNSWDNNWDDGNSRDSNGISENTWENKWNNGNSWDNNWNDGNSWDNNWDDGNSRDSNGNSGNTWDNNWNNGNSWDNNWDNGNSWDNNWDNGNSWDNNQNSESSRNNDWNDGNSWDNSWNGGNDFWWKRGKVVRLKQDGRKRQSDKQLDTDRNNKRQMNIAKVNYRSLHSADKDELHQLRQSDATKSGLGVKQITQRNSPTLRHQIRQLFNRKRIDRQLKPKMKKGQRLSTLKRFVSLVKSLKKRQLKTKQKDDERKQ